MLPTGVESLSTSLENKDYFLIFTILACLLILTILEENYVYPHQPGSHFLLEGSRTNKYQQEGMPGCVLSERAGDECQVPIGRGSGGQGRSPL